MHNLQQLEVSAVFLIGVNLARVRGEIGDDEYENDGGSERSTGQAEHGIFPPGLEKLRIFALKDDIAQTMVRWTAALIRDKRLFMPNL